MEYPLLIMKNKKIPGILATACALALTACDSGADEPDGEDGWRAIDAGDHSAIEDETRVVINDGKTWNAWWKEHAKNIHDTSQPDGIKAPEVDLEKETVLVATLGMRSSGGHSIRFAGVNLDGETLTATLQTTSPGPEDIVTMALTYPFAIIAVPKHEGEVVFVVK